MSIMLNQITVGDLKIMIVDSDPRIGSGMEADIGSLVMIEGQAGIYQKSGSGLNDWILSSVDQVSLNSQLDALDGRLDSLELDPVTKNYVDTADQAIDGRLDALELDPVTKTYVDDQDASTLSSAKSYADQKVSDLVNSAPAVLDTLKELSDALGGDANFATTVAGQIGALDTRVGALEQFKNAQIVYVSKSGSDSTGTGGQHKPYASVTAAMNSITDASPTKRYVVRISAGNYTETSVAIKANVFLIGENKESVRITGPVSMNADFNQPSSVDCRSGASMITFLSAADFNWQTVTSPAGKLYFNEVIFGSTVNMYGHNNAIAQAQFDSCVLFGALTISGINVGVFTNNVCFSNVTLNQHPNGGMATILNAAGGYCGGTLRLTTTVNDFNRRAAAFLRSFWSENLIIDGPSCYADCDLNSQGKSSTQKLNGGQLIALAPRISHDLQTQMITPISTNSHNLGDWGKQWMFNFAYVFGSSGTDLYIMSTMQNYDSAGDSDGKDVYLLADGYGLKENVDGGNINIETSNVSGTGVRGKIVLNGREVDVSSKKIVNVQDPSSAQDAATKAYVDSKDSATLSSAQAYADQKVADLVNSAPAVLDTLKELSDALGGDASFASTVAGQIGDVDDKVDQEILDRASADALKLDLAGGTMSGDLNMGANDIVNVSSLGIGTVTPGSAFEIVDNNVKHSFRGTSTSTIGAVNAVLATFTPAADSVELVKIMVTGFDADSKDSVTYERTVRVKNNGGTVSLGTIQSDYTSEDPSMTSAVCTFIVNASDVDVRVTGVNSKTITWKCLMRRMS